jgi:hypothetical protein
MSLNQCITQTHTLCQLGKKPTLLGKYFDHNETGIKERIYTSVRLVILSTCNIDLMYAVF